MSGRGRSRGSSRNEAKAVENPSQQQERAFLVGVEFRSQGRAARKKSASLTRGAQAARDHAASAGASHRRRLFRRHCRRFAGFAA